jgi:acetyl/propionyl-CoA carboxylase alpha subunit
VLEAARGHGADAIHPGYGFLSENADFAQAVVDAGFVFIGPTPVRWSAMGDKLSARRSWRGGRSGGARPHRSGARSRRCAIEVAERIGYPVLLKAAAGGGGKGMRVVRSAAEMASRSSAPWARRSNAFGNAPSSWRSSSRIPRHIEVQVLGDTHGEVIHLFERECSVQRRHQKVIEESPSPSMTPATRERCAKPRCPTARAVDYTNAGTVEFILPTSRATSTSSR